MHTILGAGGAVARALTPNLLELGHAARLVSRNPRPVADAETLAADLTNPEAADLAVRGSAVCYLTAGLPYSAPAWERDWPQIMENVIRACARHGARLVFFDNVYMYDPDYLHRMTENTPFRPVSRKGRVRARIAQTLMETMERGEVEALFARSADFFGPGRPSTGVLNLLAFEQLSRGKKALWMGRADQPHTFTYLPDAGRALAVLGTSDEAYGEVWHLPTLREPFTAREWVAAVAESLGAEPRLQLITRPMARLAGLFDPLVRESVEMMYQYERPYVFDSSKIAARFGLEPTPALAAIEEAARADYGSP